MLLVVAQGYRIANSTRIAPIKIVKFVALARRIDIGHRIPWSETCPVHPNHTIN